ncbi:MAG: porin [Polyangiaceae bacterium]|nr:porin [Polyangiaceae bacterium]
MLKRLFSVGAALVAATLPLGVARADVTVGNLPIVLGGYAEAYYQYNTNQPQNGITNYRGFDNRSQTFTISNVALDALWDWKDLVGRLTLQIGSTPDTYYAAEPTRAGSAGANASGPQMWKYIQQAYAGYRIPLGRGLLVQAGIFLSPIGPESMAVKDNYNFSRSNLFFGLPFYHTGVRISYPLSDRWSATVAAYNGWNSVVDNNDAPSVSAQLVYTIPQKIAFSLLYFGGVERSTDAPEGTPWRHLADAHLTWYPTDRLSFIAHANAGFERNNFGTSAWGAGALAGRVNILPWLYGAARADIFGEEVASNPSGQAASIFWPVSWVSSATATIGIEPHERVSFRLEYRHDHAADNMFFGGNITGDGTNLPFQPNRDFQNTVTVGAVSWF